MKYIKRKDGWYREINLSGSTEPTYQRVAPDLELQLQAKFPDGTQSYDTETTILPIQRDGLKEMIKDATREMMSDNILQKLKDDASLRDQKDGGGVLTYQRGMDMRSSGKSIYEEVTDTLDELHLREAKGDQKAKQQLDGLFEILGKKIMKMTGENVCIMACPRCGFGIDTLSSTICPKCSLDLEEKGWIRFGDVYGGRRR